MYTYLTYNFKLFYRITTDPKTNERIAEGYHFKEKRWIPLTAAEKASRIDTNYDLDEITEEIVQKYISNCL